MKKIIIILFALIVLLAAGAGGYFYFYKIKHQGKNTEAIVIKPILFAQINNLVVSVQQGQSDNENSSGENSSSSQVFIEISVQFSTNDPKAIDNFNAVLPIIQSKIVNLLMGETSEQIMNPNAQDSLSASLLAIANGVLNESQDFKPRSPFLHAYITNIVQQS